MSYKTVIRLIAFFVALLLLYAAAGQLQQYTLFCLQLEPFLPALFPVHKWAWVIPGTAGVTAVLLLLPSTRTGALLAALLLLNLYTMGLTIRLDDHYTVPCNCGEPLQELSIAAHIAFNLVCVALVAVAVSLSGKNVKRETSNGKRPIIGYDDSQKAFPV